MHIEHSTVVMELRVFFGLCNVFRRFMPNFGHFATLLNKKACEGQLLTFNRLTNDEINALETLGQN